MAHASGPLTLLTNPTAGRGKGARACAIALESLRAAGYDVRPVSGRNAEESLALAHAAVGEDRGPLVVCGGDGMVHLSLQAVGGTTTPLGIIPAGTGNDVARYLDLPRKDAASAARVVAGGRERAVDLARIEPAQPGGAPTYFVTVLAAGFDAVVNERANQMTWPRGQMRYNLASLAELRTLRPIPYEITLDDRETALDATLVAVGNGPSFGGGLRITEGAVLDDGLLDVVVIRPLGKLELLRTYPKLFRGTHVHHPQYEHHRVRQVTVRAPGIVAYADGERVGPLPLTVGVVPGALRVLVP